MKRLKDMESQGPIYEIRNCTFAYRCTADWDKLEDTGIEQVRHCHECDKDVHFCETDQQLTDAIYANHCVAIERRTPKGLRSLWLGLVTPVKK
jgi:hypothetical protein